MNINDRIGPPNLRLQGAQMLTALVMDLLDKHIHGDYGCLDRKNFLRDLHDGFVDGGYQILTDQIRSTCGMPPVGPEGWTRAELLLYEAKRRELMLRPIIAVEGAFTGGPDLRMGKVARTHHFSAKSDRVIKGLKSPRGGESCNTSKELYSPHPWPATS